MSLKKPFYDISTLFIGPTGQVHQLSVAVVLPVPPLKFRIAIFRISLNYCVMLFPAE